MAEALGLVFTAVGESSLSDLKVRPDYAAQVDGAICGYIEVKAYPKGADPTRWRPASHDGRQWIKLKALPNVLYTDGAAWGLYRSGERLGELVTLTGDLRTAGAALACPDSGLARLLSDFLRWSPVAPRSIGQLVRTVAPLTRLLRDEVIDTLAREQTAGHGPFTDLAADWRALLFPDANDAAFADGYAQSIAFALLLARTENISFDGKALETIARELGRSHALLGKALSVLTDETIGALAVTLSTLVRVVSVVDFSRFAHHVADPYLALYEHFLAEYDPDLRRQTGSYYTPTAVVSAMTRLTDQALRTRLDRPLGLADQGVTIVDPAMGTGTYILDVIESVARTVTETEGPGAVPGQLRDVAARLIGIEKQTGPFAVAEMRIAEALARHRAGAPAGGVRLYVADTLDDPFVEQTRLAATMEPIAASRRRANEVKATEPVMVVLGNPPYRENAAGQGGFIEDGSPHTAWAIPPLSAFKEPGTGRYQKDLANLYVYFWRWATWKVFDAHPEAGEGVICFITTAGYLKGPGFAGMRRYLRTHASEGWVIDCTPEGHQPDVATRIFGGVQQPVAIGIFARRADTNETTPAPVHYRALHGRQAAKFDTLKQVDLDDPDWELCPGGTTDWTAPFLPAGGKIWQSSPALGDLMPWQIPGLTPNRTWVYAPLPQTLAERWDALVHAPATDKSALFRPSRDATLTRTKPGLTGFPHSSLSVAEETGPALGGAPVAYRSFDVQYVIPDDRLMHCPRPDLWRVRGEHQIHVTELHSETIRSGPGLTFAAHTPDIHHYKGSAGGRVLPLYAGTDTSTPNLAPGLLDLLVATMGHPVSADDVLAYIAAVCAHPAYTTRFADDLRTPSVRVPLTADPDLWDETVLLGRTVLWLHTRGQRYADPRQSRPKDAPRVPDARRRPMVIVAIPGNRDTMPDTLDYDPATQTLSIGTGQIAPVPPAVIHYEVSGMNVLRKWFGYRRATRPQARGEQSALDDIRPESWPAAYTTDLLNLLNVLIMVTDLEHGQAELLERVMAGPRITTGDLNAAGVLPVPAGARTPLPKPGRPTSADQLTLGAPG